jgi:cyclin-dependent kinase
MVKLSPLFNGDSEIDELFRIFRLCGTPTEETWPGVSELEFYGPAFPLWPKLKLKPLLTAAPNHPGVDDDLVDLIDQLLVYQPSKRLTTKAACDHPYFTTGN